MADSEREVADQTATGGEEDRKLPEGAIDVSDREDDGEPQVETKDPVEAVRRERRAYTKELREQLKERDGKLAEMEKRYADLEKRVSRPQLVQPQRQEVDPVQSRLEFIETQKRTLHRAMKAPELTEEDVIQLRRQWEFWDNERVRAIANGSRPQQQDQQGVTQEQIAGQVLAMEFPAIYADETLLQMAYAEYKFLIDRHREPPGIGTARKANQRLSERLGIGQKPPTGTAEERAKRAGTAGRGTQQGGADWSPSPMHKVNALAWAKGTKREGWDEKEILRAYYRDVLKPNGLAS